LSVVYFPWNLLGATFLHSFRNAVLLYTILILLIV
jgi:hypothetical protein